MFEEIEGGKKCEEKKVRGEKKTQRGSTSFRCVLASCKRISV